MYTVSTQVKTEPLTAPVQVFTSLLCSAWKELPRSGNNHSAVPSDAKLASLRADMIEGKRNPAAQVFALAECGVRQGIRPATMLGPFRYLSAHLEQLGQRRSRAERPVEVVIARETRANQKLDLVQFRIAANPLDSDALREGIRCADEQMAETAAFRDSCYKRLAEVLNGTVAA